MSKYNLYAEIYNSNSNSNSIARSELFHSSILSFSSLGIEDIQFLLHYEEVW